ncbi:autotransporter outer membrane beta-barrel domain-containing protein [Parasphingorhabdus cellanae]|uniref:Autotransporter outer membrane beta-barrel domain-containing protein n=1 Tax=Parasphingorhabdus cellanae TaxID=2806553 RepID=A0ABX7T0Z6_9SPHN|nr:autotransporter outer membrane beta-barrel domain-containing protein [Parasphingorhabdus cellanae]QTD55219.1 autotransporter outer membrane beta-barrel domain-containing protein [Parasphingorhabdus cellanae]
MHKLLACTSLTPILLVAAGPVHAETVIDSARTTPIATSDNNDDIRITNKGSIKPTGGTAVIIDSNHDVTNEGTIQITGADSAVGISAETGTSGTITNSGSIIIDEDYTPKDSDDDGDLDGRFANGKFRFGIGTEGGYSGAIVNSGTITIEGNDSAGIYLGDRLDGSLNHSGQITVTGDDSVGIKTSDVAGDVTVRGSVAVRGENAVGVAIWGQVEGGLLIQNTVTASGYRSTTRPGDVSKLDADDLLQGGPAIAIYNDVADGIFFDVRPENTDPKNKDEDGDGIDDDKEGNASVTSYGEAAAVQIGSATNTVTIGEVKNDESEGNGIFNNGSIRGLGVYEGVAANALVIGGLGGATEIVGGILNRGSISAVSLDDDATAIRIGDRATMVQINNDGEIVASGGSAADTAVYAILVEERGALEGIYTTKKISATAAKDGQAGAIIDRSGTLEFVFNSGTIEAISENGGEGKAVAIDLSNNNNGTEIAQFRNSSQSPAPVIIGDILLGSGDDFVGSAAGRIEGRLDFGGGFDEFELEKGAQFTGWLSQAAGTDITINDSSMLLTDTGTIDINSIVTENDSTIGVTIDGKSGKFTQLNVADTAEFGEGTNLEIQLVSVSESEGRYQIVDANNLVGSENLAQDGVVTAYMFKSSVTGDDDEGAVWVDIKRKTAEELKLTRSQTSAYDAIFKVLDNDAAVSSSFLGATTAETFDETIQQMLPDHAGGVFATVSQGSRSTARFLTDPVAPYSDQGGWGFWLQQTVWGVSKDRGQTDSYDITGLGTTAGIEVETGSIGNFGVSFGYLNSNDSDDDAANEVDSDQYEFAAYWRARWGGLRAFARGSYAKVEFDSQRRFESKIDGDDKTERRFAVADWSGDLYSFAGGLAYEMDIGRVSLRPSVSVDYYNLSEEGYTETEGGDAFNLIVEDRDSDELALNTTLAAALNFGDTDPDGVWFRAEVEGGYRQIIGGDIGNTTAKFKDGDAFTLSPDTRTDGWLAGVRLVSGTGNLLIAGEFSAEEQLRDHVSYGARLSLRIGF